MKLDVSVAAQRLALGNVQALPAAQVHEGEKAVEPEDLDEIGVLRGNVRGANGAEKLDIG